MSQRFKDWKYPEFDEKGMTKWNWMCQYHSTSNNSRHDGMSQEEILKAYPDLEPEDIRQALQYAAEAVSERELPLVSAP